MTDSAEQKSKRVQVTVTESTYRVIKQYAALKGVTMSQALYEAFRCNLHREALEEADVRRIFERNGLPIDEDIKREWRNARALGGLIE